MNDKQKGIILMLIVFFLLLGGSFFLGYGVGINKSGLDTLKIMQDDRSLIISFCARDASLVDLNNKCMDVIDPNITLPRLDNLKACEVFK